MYKKAAGLLVLGNLIFMMGFLCFRGIEHLQLVSRPVLQMILELDDLDMKAMNPLGITSEFTAYSDNLTSAQGIGIVEVAVSGQRVVDYELMEQEPAYVLSDDELEVLLRIVEAEAGSEDEDGRLLVANVVLNRVNSESFPNTVSEVVFQKSMGVTQFSPVSSGRYYTVEVTEETVSAVERALAGEDISRGALYFASRKRANTSKMRWFDTHLTFLFEHGGHEFFK